MLHWRKLRRSIHYGVRSRNTAFNCSLGLLGAVRRVFLRTKSDAIGILSADLYFSSSPIRGAFLFVEVFMKDTFSSYHPAVNFLFFVGAVGCGVVFLHPAYLAVSILCGLSYYLFLGKTKSAKAFLLMLPVVLILAAVNPLFNTQGSTVLFWLFGKPYTLEALLYGGAVSGVLLTMLLWFGCYNYVLTGDKFTSLFGNWIPSVSLLLVMVLRMVPNLIQKTKQIAGARKSLGKGNEGKLKEGLAVVGALVSWALEGGVVTADSMRARGYGTAKRQSFLIYRMERRDWWLLAVEIILITAVIVSACLGQVNAEYTPEVSLAPVSWGAVFYGIYLLIPLALNGKEAILWHILRFKI